MELALAMVLVRRLASPLVWAFAALAVLATACATPGAPLPPDVKDPARRAYYEGMRKLLDADYVKATTLFQAVAASPKQVKYGALAKLRLGDALFFQGRYAEASEVFRNFVQQHNADPNIPYARFKVAECLYERLPSEWFASPPAEEYDQTISTQAEAELKGFITTFPTSIYTPRARKMLTETRTLLFKSELYVADFYESQEKWQAVAWRLRDAIEAYPELAMKDELVWRMSMAWDKVGDRTETASALGLYLSKFPTGKRAEAAKSRLAAIKLAIDEQNKPKEPPPAPKPPGSQVEKPPQPEAPKPDEKKPDEAPTPDEPTPDDFKLKPPELPPTPE